MKLEGGERGNDFLQATRDNVADHLQEGREEKSTKIAHKRWLNYKGSELREILEKYKREGERPKEFLAIENLFEDKDIVGNVVGIHANRSFRKKRSNSATEEEIYSDYVSLNLPDNLSTANPKEAAGAVIDFVVEKNALSMNVIRDCDIQAEGGATAGQDKVNNVVILEATEDKFFFKGEEISCEKYRLLYDYLKFCSENKNDEIGGKLGRNEEFVEEIIKKAAVVLEEFREKTGIDVMKDMLGINDTKKESESIDIPDGINACARIILQSYNSLQRSSYKRIPTLVE